MQAQRSSFFRAAAGQLEKGEEIMRFGKPFAALLLAFVATTVLFGCATTDDLRFLRRDLDQKIAAVDEKVAAVEPKIQAVKDEGDLLRRDVQANRDAVALARKNQANAGADIGDLRDAIQQVRGGIDGLRKELSNSTVQTKKKDDELKDLREKLDSLSFKVSFLENYIGIGKKEEPAEPQEKGLAPSGAKDKPKTDKESLYAAAYEVFKEAKYDKARMDFQAFLKQYPDTELSDNAQFWIGECYYFENKFEKAILEYEKVVKSYPEGDKVPYALLKQGLSFQKLGDKSSARLILQQVIKDFPNTNQARIARSKLVEIK